MRTKLGICSIAGTALFVSVPLLAASPIEKESQTVPKSNDASQFASLKMAKSAGCLKGENNQFGRYLGDWLIENWTLQPDGKSWVKDPNARWVFKCFSDGVAIQDFWMPANGKNGTNFRVYNAKTKNWDVVWAVASGPGMTRINAKQDGGGNMVMHYVFPKPNPPRQITFKPPTKDGWDWELKMSYDAEKSWVTVYKIKATPWRD